MSEQDIISIQLSTIGALRYALDRASQEINNLEIKLAEQKIDTQRLLDRMDLILGVNAISAATSEYEWCINKDRSVRPECIKKAIQAALDATLR